MVCKIAVVLQRADKDRYKIDAGKTYNLKNLELNETVSDIPVFKANNISVFKASKMEDTNTLDFLNEEIEDLKQNIKINQYQENTQPPIPQPTAEGQVLSLFDFCKSNPRDLRADQDVEV